jgi:hypothetical protein
MAAVLGAVGELSFCTGLPTTTRRLRLLRMSDAEHVEWMQARLQAVTVQCCVCYASGFDTREALVVAARRHMHAAHCSRHWVCTACAHAWVASQPSRAAATSSTLWHTDKHEQPRLRCPGCLAEETVRVGGTVSRCCCCRWRRRSISTTDSRCCCGGRVCALRRPAQFRRDAHGGGRRRRRRRHGMGMHCLQWRNVLGMRHSTSRQ